MRGHTGEGAIFKFDDDDPWLGGLKGCAIRRYHGNAMQPMLDQPSGYNWPYPMGTARRTPAKKEERKRRIPNEKALGEKSFTVSETNPAFRRKIWI